MTLASHSPGNRRIPSQWGLRQAKGHSLRIKGHCCRPGTHPVILSRGQFPGSWEHRWRRSMVARAEPLPSPLLAAHCPAPASALTLAPSRGRWAMGTGMSLHVLRLANGSRPLYPRRSNLSSQGSASKRIVSFKIDKRRSGVQRSLRNVHPTASRDLSVSARHRRLGCA